MPDRIWSGWPMRSREVAVADLDAAIRAALDNTEHGDRPDGGMCHVDCCGDGYVCECGLDEKPRAALRAILDLRAPESEEHDDPVDFGLLTDGWWACYDEMVRAIASAVGVPQAEKPQP